MGEARKDALKLDFDSRLKLEFHGTKVTSDAGLLAYRELDDALGLTTMTDSELCDNQTGKNIQHSIAALLKQSIYSRLTGYADTNDAERLCLDPAMRHVAGDRAIECTAASTSLMGRFETEKLTQSKNLELLMGLPGKWVNRVHQRKLLKQIILDMDSSVSPTYGSQEGSVYNGYFECTFYHPLFCFNQYGDLERVLLRNGNIHSADDWRSLLEPIVLYHSFRYQAASWKIAHRVVAKIEWHAGELFPRVNFIVTNLRWKSSNVVKFYNKRGTAEQWIKEGKYPLNWTRLSCHDFVDDKIRLQLFALAYNLGNFLRRLVLPKPVRKWTLRTLREKLIKIEANIVRHSQYIIFQMAEVFVPRALFREILERIGRLMAGLEFEAAG